jgi:threonine aldolase
MKYSFKNDYSEGCHPSILEALMRTNFSQQNGYGLDDYCAEASNIIKEKSNSPDSKVHFVSGGTQANLIVISSILKPHESVISAHTGHIFTNETGAIEATGHKVHGVETLDGKLRPKDIQNFRCSYQYSASGEAKVGLYLQFYRSWNNLYQKRTRRIITIL